LCEVIFESSSKLQRIEKQALYYSSVKTIQIPSSVELIGEHCFSVCQSLCEVIQGVSMILSATGYGNPESHSFPFKASWQYPDPYGVENPEARETPPKYGGVLRPASGHLAKK
jgi:hypothetical protein